MAKFEAATAASVIGVAAFQLLQTWNSNAPSLQDLRSAEPHDAGIRQKLYDADFMVGGLATIIGVTFAVLTHDMTALYIMLVVFGGVSLWHHSVLNAAAR